MRHMSCSQLAGVTVEGNMEAKGTPVKVQLRCAYKATDELLWRNNCLSSGHIFASKLHLSRRVCLPEMVQMNRNSIGVASDLVHARLSTLWAPDRRFVLDFTHFWQKKKIPFLTPATVGPWPNNTVLHGRPCHAGRLPGARLGSQRYHQGSQCHGCHCGTER